ncbi:hypothetical protein J3R30DRAFT_834973 [Lentinula aciculospora]|uniref:Uncharacterized protein n=1 Tax=Lentinula aciculospora TaxID=153920 RepID=A0A9W9DUZ4_9AGAR|nr:hypothetical protein J3R30DRAFT_834973 [Lentinula aciculospora]
MLLPLVYIVLGALAAVYAAPLTTTTHEFERSVFNNGTHLQVRDLPLSYKVRLSWTGPPSKGINVPEKVKESVIKAFPITAHGGKPQLSNVIFETPYNGSYDFFYKVSKDKWKRVVFSSAQEAILEGYSEFSAMRDNYAKPMPIYIRFDGECDPEKTLFLENPELPPEAVREEIGRLLTKRSTLRTAVDRLVFVGPFKENCWVSV